VPVNKALHLPARFMMLKKMRSGRLNTGLMVASRVMSAPSPGSTREHSRMAVPPEDTPNAPILLPSIRGWDCRAATAARMSATHSSITTW
jgi:hypothetical protein